MRQCFRLILLIGIGCCVLKNAPNGVSDGTLSRNEGQSEMDSTPQNKRDNNR
jgi:hypothetical protein